MNKIKFIRGFYPVSDILDDSEIANEIVKTMLDYKLYNQLMIIKLKYV